jgi:peroxiredoxin family protein
MESLRGIINDIRIFMYGGLRTLPFTLAGTMLILGLMSANYAILFFLLGFIVLVPILSSVLNSLADAVLPSTWFKATSNDICKLVIPYATLTNNSNSSTGVPVTVFTTVWTSMMAFFFGYILMNGIQLINVPAEESEDDTEAQTGSTSNRMSQAIISIVTSIIALFVVFGFRLYTGCETKLGILVTLLIFGGLGISWYYGLSLIGQNRLSDLFGIANRLLPASAMQNGPVACLPILVPQTVKGASK